jgi:hypothetical protein
MVSIILLASGIHRLLALAVELRNNAKFFYTSVLPDIERNPSSDRGRGALRDRMHQLTIPNSPDMKLPEPQPPGLPIQLIFHTVQAGTSSCFIT